MLQLTKTGLSRLLHQKFFWIYLAAMLIYTVIIAINLAAAPPGDYWAEIYAGEKFPLYMMSNQHVIIGPLFMSIIAALIINYEKSLGMLKQPILHGKTKQQLLNAKIMILVIVTLACAVLFFLFSFLVGAVIWREAMLDWAAVKQCLRQFLLLLMPLTVLCIGLVLLALNTTKMAFTIGAVMFLVLFDSLVNQFFTAVVSRFSFMYYIYAYVDFSARTMEGWMIPRGIVICAVTAIILYLLSVHKIHRMEFR